MYSNTIVTPKSIREIRKSVEQYEQNVIDRAKYLEQVKLIEEEALRLQKEASKLKSKESSFFIYHTNL